MMWAFLQFALLLGISVPRVAADSTFITPGRPGSSGWKSNPSYDAGDSMNVEWDTDLDKTSLLLWQDYPSAGGNSQFFVTLKADTASASFIWEVSLVGFSSQVRDNEDAVFHFSLFPAAVNNAVANSLFFNVPVPKDETATIAASVTVAQSPISTASETSTTASTDVTTDTARGDDSSLSNGAVAGIAVGATIGGLLVLGGFGFFSLETLPQSRWRVEQRICNLQRDASRYTY